MDNNNFEIGFEKPPVGGNEQNVEAWGNSMSHPPEFAGEDFGAEKSEKEPDGTEYILQYVGGVDPVIAIDGIMKFDAYGSENPLQELLKGMGIESEEDYDNMNRRAEAFEKMGTQTDQENSPNKPVENKTREGLLAAIDDVKEKMQGIIDARPDLRERAMASGRNIVQEVVADMKIPTLAGFLKALDEQRPIESVEKTDEVNNTAIDDPFKGRITEGINQSEEKQPENNQEIKEDKRDQDILNPEILEKEEDTINEIKEESLNPNIVDPKDLEKMEKDAA